MEQSVLNLLQQNRLSFAVNHKLKGGTALQLGYLQQVLKKGSGLAAERNHVLLVDVRHNLDFRD